MCGLVCPSRTSERGGKGDCEKGGGGEQGERVKERALGRLLLHPSTFRVPSPFVVLRVLLLLYWKDLRYVL